MDWDPIPEGSENGVLNGYKVEYWETRHNQSAAQETSKDEYTAVLDGLSYNTVYTIRVAAFTSSGSGDYSEPILVKTKKCKLKFINPLNHLMLLLPSVCVDEDFVFILTRASEVHSYNTRYAANQNFLRSFH